MRGPGGLLVGVLLGALAACAGTSMPTGLQSPDPGERARALADPQLMEDEATIPSRIEALDSDDPLVRMLAIRSLERMTGHTFGYDHASDPLERDRAASRWRAWYERERADAPAPASVEQP